MPLVAVQNDEDGEYVWVIQGDGSAKRVRSSSTIEGDLVVVTGDLKVGDVLQVLHESSIQAAGPFSGGDQ